MNKKTVNMFVILSVALCLPCSILTVFAGGGVLAGAFSEPEEARVAVDMPLQPTTHPTRTRTPTLTPLPTSDVSDWPLTFADDFDDPNSGFSDRSYAHGRLFHEDGRYGIEVLKDNWVMYTSRGYFTNFALEVDVTPQYEAGAAGVIFRSTGGNQFYSFHISTDGQYSLDKLIGAEDEQANWETILPWQESPHLRTGLATNRLGVICVGPPDMAVCERPPAGHNTRYKLHGR